MHAAFVPEYEALPETVQDELLAHIAVLETFGPQLGRFGIAVNHRLFLCREPFSVSTITKADSRFDAHLADLKTREAKKKGRHSIAGNAMPARSEQRVPQYKNLYNRLV